METPGAITCVTEGTVGCVEVASSVLGTAAKSRGRLSSRTPRAEQLASHLVTGLQKIPRPPPSPSACWRTANVSAAVPECLFWQWPEAWPAGRRDVAGRIGSHRVLLRVRPGRRVLFFWLHAA